MLLCIWRKFLHVVEAHSYTEIDPEQEHSGMRKGCFEHNHTEKSFPYPISTWYWISIKITTVSDSRTLKAKRVKRESLSCTCSWQVTLGQHPAFSVLTISCVVPKSPFQPIKFLAECYNVASCLESSSFPSSTAPPHTSSPKLLFIHCTTPLLMYCTCYPKLPFILPTSMPVLTVCTSFFALYVYHHDNEN